MEEPPEPAVLLLRWERFHGLFAEVLVERVVARCAGNGLAAPVGSVRLHRPALLAVGAQRVEDGEHALARFRRDAFDERLDAAAGVSVKKIAGADENALLRAFTEDKDARMLQIAPHNAAHRDVLRIPRNARTQAADAADEKLRAHPRARSADESGHNADVVHGIDLDRNAPGLALCRLRRNESKHAGAVAQRRDPERLRLRRRLAGGERFECLRGVAPDALVGRNDRKIGILLAGDLVIVAGADLCEVLHALAALSRNEAELAVNLHLRQAVNDLTAGVLEHLGVVDVVLLVKPGAQLQKAEHALSPIRGICERRGNLAACREPVERDADGNDVRIVRRLVEVFHKRAHALERVREQKILLFQIREKLALLQLHRFPAAPLGVLHAGRLLHAGAEREIERQLCGKNVALRHLEILDERRAQPRGRFAADHEAHRLLALALAQHFLHAGAEVRVVSAQIVVNEYVGVARDL